MNDQPKAPADRRQLREVKTILADPQVLALRFSPCGKYLVAGCYDARAGLWDATKDEFPELPAAGGHQGWTQAICVSKDGSLLFSGDSWGELRAWRLSAAGATLQWKIEQAHAGWLRDVATSPDGNILATCGADRTVRLWSTADGSKLRQWRGENEDLYVVSFSPDGQHVLSGDRLGRVWQWAVADGKPVRQFDASTLHKLDRIQDIGGVRCLAFDNSASLLAVGGMKPKNGATIQGVPTLLVYDWASGELRHTHPLGGENDCDLMGVHLHQDGFFIAVTNGGPGQGKLILQRLGDPEPLLVETKIANVQSLAVHPGGRRLAVSGTNNGSNGNGRQLASDGTYPGNKSPIHVFEIAAEAAG